MIEPQQASVRMASPPRSSSVQASRVLLAVFLLTLAVEHILRSGLTPDRHRISEYAIGSSGWLMTAGFFAWALSLAAAEEAVRGSRLRPDPARKALCMLLAVAATGTLVTALFHTGTSAGVVPRGHTLTAANHLHDLGSDVLALMLWAGAIVSLVLGERRLRIWAFGILAGAVVCVTTLSLGGLPGIEQRALVVLGCAWQYALLAAAARSRPPRA